MAKALNKPQADATVYRDGYDALRHMLDEFDSITVGTWLIEEGYWPEMPPESAGARVRACCNPDKNQFFKFNEIVFLMARTGHADPLYFACDVTNHQRPTKRQTAKDAAERLAQELRDLERELDAKRSTYHAAVAQAADETFPSPRGIRRLRFSLWWRR